MTSEGWSLTPVQQHQLLAVLWSTPDVCGWWREAEELGVGVHNILEMSSEEQLDTMLRIPTLQRRAKVWLVQHKLTNN